MKWFAGIFAIPIFYGIVWAMDTRIEQKMGTVVDDQMDRREIQYLEFQKKSRELTDQEQRDLDYYKEQLRVRQLGESVH